MPQYGKDTIHPSHRSNVQMNPVCNDLAYQQASYPAPAYLLVMVLFIID
jgi:hypothetical protein